jgi:feruloyl esterase
VAASFAAVVIPASMANAATCESLAVLKLPHTTITSASTVVPGAFVPPAASAAAANKVFASLPAFCRVAATLTPSNDSDIKIEVWLPDQSRWNGKLEAT